MRRKVLGSQADAATGAWVLHDWRGNTFRFVVCRNSIQGAMVLPLVVSNHGWQPYGDVLGRKVEGFDGRSRKQR